MERRQNHALLFEMLRSFSTLARTLNLSHAVRELGSTRQTVRRHIALLEEARGEALFAVDDRQYRLTEAGRRSLDEAEKILGRGEAWLNNQVSHVDGLFHIRYDTDSEFNYYLQQHPISRIWRTPSVLMRETLRRWATAEGEIEHRAMDAVRPYLMVYRRHDADWFCVEVGEKSSYATWFGWRWARSTIGRAVGALPAGSAFGTLLDQPFHDVHTTHGLRLDHIHTQIPRGDSAPREPISYSRLLLGSRFPDGTFALTGLIERSYDLEIDGLSAADIRTMAPDLVMNITPGMLKSEATGRP